MPEFCSQCTPADKADHNLIKMALHLDNGHSRSFVCDRCDNRAVYKDEEGRYWLAIHIEDNPGLKWQPVNLDDLEFKTT
ncbi:MAG: hypothetical protein RLP14_10320 [Owenweeksia sp.]